MEIVIAREEPGRRLPTIHRFNKTDLLIGRGWHCDLVLVDEEIDAEHARILIDIESDKFLLEDRDSRNGVRVGNRMVKTSHHAKFGEAITIGQTTFTVNRADDAVAPAVAHSNVERYLDRVSKPMATLLFAAFAIVVALFNEHISGVSKFSWNSSMTSAMTLGTGMLMIALVGGGAAKLFKHRMRGWSHLWVLAALALLKLLSEYVNRFIAFNSLNPTLTGLLETTANALLLMLWVWLALIISTNLKARARNAIALVVMLGFITTSYILPKVRQADWQASPQLETTTLPPSLLFRSAQSPTKLNAMIKSTIDQAREDAKARKIKRDEEDEKSD